MAKEESAFTLTRSIDAPRDLVFKAWTETERLIQWWGPGEFKMVIRKGGIRTGEIFHFGMESPDGRKMWSKFVYQEILFPEKLVFINSFSDENGGTTRHPMMAGWPLEILNTQIFTEHGLKTTLSMTGIPINATEEENKVFRAGFPGMLQHRLHTLDRLEAYLAKAERID